MNPSLARRIRRGTAIIVAVYVVFGILLFCDVVTSPQFSTTEILIGVGVYFAAALIVMAITIVILYIRTRANEAARAAPGSVPEEWLHITTFRSISYYNQQLSPDDIPTIQIQGATPVEE